MFIRIIFRTHPLLLMRVMTAEQCQQIITTAEVCFPSAAQDVVKEAVYLDNTYLKDKETLGNKN